MSAVKENSDRLESMWTRVPRKHHRLINPGPSLQGAGSVLAPVWIYGPDEDVGYRKSVKNPGKRIDLSGVMGQIKNVCEHAQGRLRAPCMLEGVPRFA